MAKQRVYRALNPPFSGGRQYVDVSSKKEAIETARDLNSKAKKKDWVFSRL